MKLTGLLFVKNKDHECQSRKIPTFSPPEAGCSGCSVKLHNTAVRMQVSKKTFVVDFLSHRIFRYEFILYIHININIKS